MGCCRNKEAGEAIAKKLAAKGLHREALIVKHLTQAGWEDLPTGWTQDSARKFWNSLTGDKTHKISQCIKKVAGTGISDPGAFCGSLASLVGYR